MTDTKAKKTIPGATIKLEGDCEADFKTIKEKIETAIPGIRPNKSDVLRYALHLAANPVALKS